MDADGGSRFSLSFINLMADLYAGQFWSMALCRSVSAATSCWARSLLVASASAAAFFALMSAKAVLKYASNLEPSPKIAVRSGASPS